MSEPIQNPLTPYERLRRGPDPRAVVAVMIGFFLFLVVPGVFAVCYAVFAEQALIGRLLFLALAAVCLFLPVWIAWIYGRRKWKTGSWRPSPEEWMELRAKSAGKKLPRWVGWLNPLLSVVYLVGAAAAIKVALRDPSDRWNDVFIVIWIALGVQSIWQLYRDARRPSAA